MTEPGAVVLAQVDGQERALALGASGVWWFNAGGKEGCLRHDALAALPWRLGKVVEA